MLRSRFSLQNKYVAPLAVVIVGLLAYGWDVTFQYAQFDDDTLITERAAYLANPHSLLDAFNAGYWAGTRVAMENTYYRPLVTVTYILDTLIAPGSPNVAHVTNLLIHLATSLALLALFRRTVTNQSAATLLAVLFACHPLASSATGWIMGRNDSLVGLFSVLTFLGFLGYARRESIWSLIGFAFAFSAAVLCKETALAMPLILALWLWVEREDRTLLRWLPVGVASIGIVVMWLVIRNHVIEQATHLSSPSPQIGAAVFLQGFGKMLLPLNLSVLSTVNDSSYWFGLVACLVLAALIWRTPHINAKRVLFGLAWFSAFLAPSLLTRDSPAALNLECRLYLPLIGILFVFAETSILRGLVWSGWRRVLIVGMVTAFIVLSNVFALRIRNPEAMWTNVIRNAPSSSLAHVNYGSYLWRTQRVWEAEAQFKEALQIDSSNAWAHSDLAELMRVRGSLDSAEMHYWAQITLGDANPYSWYGLAEIAVRRNDPAKALEMLKAGINVNPNIPEIWKSMSLLYVQLGNRQGAASCAQKLRTMSAPIPADVTRFLNRQ